MAGPNDADRVNMSQGMLRQALLAKALREQQLNALEAQASQGGMPPGAPPGMMSPTQPGQQPPASPPMGQGQLSPMAGQDPRLRNQAQLAALLRARQAGPLASPGP